VPAAPPPPAPGAPAPAARGAALTALVCLASGLAFGLGLAHHLGWDRLHLPVSHVRHSDWDYQLTLLEAVGRQVAEGLPPWWNPWTAGGVPLWANPEAPVLHPLALLAAALHPGLVARLQLVSHLCLFAGGAALLARALGAPRRALPVAAALVCAVDVLSFRLFAGHLMMTQAAWIPIVLAALLGVAHPGRAAALGALALALAVGGGGHYPGWMGLAAGLLLCLAGATLPGWPRGRADALQRGLGLGLLTALLTAPRWLPTAAALRETARLRGPQQPLAMGDYGLLDALTFVFAAGPLTGLPPAPGGHEGLPSWGTPLVLLLGLAGAWALRRRPAPLALLLVAGGVSLGHNLPVNLFGLLHGLPPLDRLRNPERWSLVWAPLLCAVAAVGAGPLLRGRRAGIGAPALGLALAGQLWVGARIAEMHANIDQITPDSYARRPGGPPEAVAAEGASNLELAAAGATCLPCSDALLHEAPTGLREGAYGVPLDRWAPAALALTLGPSGEALLPQALRAGWSAQTASGSPVSLAADPGGTRVVGTPGARVRLRFWPPGLLPGLALGALGLLLAALGLRGAPLAAARGPE
jgi:hypothetical protein